MYMVNKLNEHMYMNTKPNEHIYISVGTYGICLCVHNPVLYVYCAYGSHHTDVCMNYFGPKNTFFSKKKLYFF